MEKLLSICETDVTRETIIAKTCPGYTAIGGPTAKDNCPGSSTDEGTYDLCHLCWDTKMEVKNEN